MSKAFAGEDASQAPIVVPPRRPLPPGVPNYVTPRGLALLRDELRKLQSERARLEGAEAGDPDRPRSLSALSTRIAQLEERLASASPVDPAAQPRDEVRFGAAVTVRSEAGATQTFRIVGVDEADAAEGRVAFVAPLARALLGKRVGDAATVRTPKGQDELDVLAIRYDSGS
jgi:transcription elongation factor GreB